jgi:hypothetical protein
MFVRFSSSTFHSLINRLDTAGLSDLLLFIPLVIVLPTILLLTSPSYKKEISPEEEGVIVKDLKKLLP